MILLMSPKRNPKFKSAIIFTHTYFNKLPQSVMSWIPCRVRLGWRCSSEDRHTPILVQVWKKLHKVCGTLLHPQNGAQVALLKLGEKEVFTFQKNPSLKTVHHCFPVSLSVNRSVFPSKSVSGKGIVCDWKNLCVDPSPVLWKTFPGVEQSTDSSRVCSLFPFA